MHLLFFKNFLKTEKMKNLKIVVIFLLFSLNLFSQYDEKSRSTFIQQNNKIGPPARESKKTEATRESQAIYISKKMFNKTTTAELNLICSRNLAYGSMMRVNLSMSGMCYLTLNSIRSFNSNTIGLNSVYHSAEFILTGEPFSNIYIDISTSVVLMNQSGYGKIQVQNIIHNCPNIISETGENIFNVSGRLYIDNLSQPGNYYNENSLQITINYE